MSPFLVRLEWAPHCPIAGSRCVPRDTRGVAYPCARLRASVCGNRLRAANKCAARAAIADLTREGWGILKRRGFQRSTILDVARSADVSSTTVSHVLNGTRFVAEATRIRVLAAVDALGYRPDAAARGLRSRQRYVIGVLITNPHNRVFASILDGLDEVLTPAGYSIIVSASRGETDRERACLRNLDDQRVDGLVVGGSAGGTTDALCRLRDHGVPMVYINGVIDQFPEVPADGVTLDFSAAGELLAVHLLELGHRRFAVLGGLGPPASASPSRSPFVLAWERTLANNGLAPDASVVYNGVSRESVGYELACQALTAADRPSALVALNTPLAVGALLACRDLGLDVPRDVSLAVLDDVLWNEIAAPSLTAIPNAWSDFGRVAGDFLLDRIAGRCSGEPRVKVFPASLIHRESTSERSTP
jgi:LacI family transcriptional regulator